ncbi:MFS transporter [Novosphingobium sp. TH158]|uniref:MFS transporter n=1 Tax=Novosphingobium sp. TH158 TaxID=2067455 RepID=UPI00130402BB|nr:MFS transporter [Novosphingobium sp. TH158]
MHQPISDRAPLGDYLGEIASNWRVLAGAGLGMAVGLQMFSYITSIFAPFLIKDFGWTRSTFALIGFTMLVTLPTMPIAGRLADRFGAKRMALAGVLLLPAVIWLFSRLQGDFRYYFACSAGVMAVGCLTSPVTYTRLIVERFQRARGLALTIVMSAPALTGILLPPTLTRFMAENGWRLAYEWLALFVLVAGLIAIALIPRDCGGAPVRKVREPSAPRERHFREVLGAPAFWAIFAGVLLTTVHTPLHGSQFVVLLNEQGLDAMAAARMLQVYSLGTLIGRIVCGVALDYYPARYVATISMMLPAFGLALLASPLDVAWAIGFAVFLIGVTVGAEGDLLSFLVGRYFRIEIFGTALGMCYCALYIASLSGVLLNSRLLATYDTFGPFLWLTAGAVLVGSLLFLRLPREAAGRTGE